MFMFDKSALIAPPKGHPGQLAYTFVIRTYISYRRLPPKMQQSPSAVLVGIYLSEVIFPCYFHTGFSYSLNLRPLPLYPKTKVTPGNFPIPFSSSLSLQIILSIFVFLPCL